METKPYNLQSPEQIAKDYSGNKQKIAEAMQMGILDPTAGTLAGMFIDRMRSAAQQEAVPQQTVAQQVFAPPAPPAPAAGLGATPQAAAVPPMDATPPMGAAPPQDMPAPQGEMPMMAEGGMVPPPYASGGGLSDVPLPDGMFDEPSNGGYGDGYAGGGMVAFAAGDVVDADEDGDGSSDTYFGYNYKDPMANAARDAALFGVPETKYANEYEADLLKRRSPEAMKAGRKKDINMALIEAGIAMANTPGSLLQSATRGIGAALPGFKAAEKERRAEEREIQKGLIDLEQGRNTAAAQKAMRLMQAQQIGIQGKEGQIGRAFQTAQQTAQFKQQSKENALDRAVQMFGYSQRGRGGDGSGGSGEGKPKYSQAQAEKGWSTATKKMDLAFTEAENLALKGDMPGAQKKFAEYKRFRDTANMYAETTGQAAIDTLPRYKTKGIQAYTNYVLKQGQPPLRADRQTVKGGQVNTLKVGTIQDGYRYKGGPPGSASSWEKVK
jgi:hypothetical protein